MIMCTSIQKISAMDLEKIMYGSDRLDNQIIDVRERGDFECASGYNTDIINLPLSKSYKWSREVVDGKFLSPKKPTVCICSDGQRSAIMAAFLGEKFCTSYFIQSLSYLRFYSFLLI